MTSTPMPAPGATKPVVTAAEAPADDGVQPGPLVAPPSATAPGVPMIAIDAISKWYGSFQVLTDCTTRVAKGEVVVVCGPSGSGKSTLIKCVNALEPFQSGQITVDGTRVKDEATNLPKLRSRVGMVFQHFELFPHLSIIENLTLAQRKVLGRGADDAKRRGYDLLARVGLSAHSVKYPGQLSGGQQQRVAVARALVAKPKLILADEPTGNLDTNHGEEVMRMLQGLNGEGTTIVMVTHSPAHADYASRVVNMLDGRILQERRRAA
jgi:glutamate/aspartate transport system ATP-binding protein